MLKFEFQTYEKKFRSILFDFCILLEQLIGNFTLIFQIVFMFRKKTVRLFSEKNQKIFDNLKRL